MDKIAVWFIIIRRIFFRSLSIKAAIFGVLFLLRAIRRH